MSTVIARALVALGICSISLIAIARDFETITVTASRTPTSIDNVGSSITVITREDILRRNASTLAELLRDVPGLAVSQQGGTGTFAQVRARGAEANQILVLIDGIEANDIAQGSEFNFAQLAASDIEAIEIIRGPQSALWGSDALAGVINVITEPGRLSVGTTSFHAEGGQKNSVRVGATIGRNLGDVTLTGGISHLRTTGSNIARSGDESDGYGNTTVRLSTVMPLTDTSRVTLSLRQTNTLTDFDDVDFLTTGLPIDAPNETQSRQRYGKASLSIQLNDNVEQIIALTHSGARHVNRTSAPISDTTGGSKDSLHAQTNFSFGSETVSVVFEHEVDSYSQRSETTPFGDPNKDLGARTSSVAAEYRHDGEIIDTSVSLRRDVNSEFASATSWRLTGLYHLTPSTAVFASAGQGIKNPTFTERFGFFDTFVGNPALRPEYAKAIEAGIRQSFADYGLTLSASVYRSRLSDEINSFVYDSVQGAFTASNTEGESRRSGAEFEAQFRPTDQLSLLAHYTRLHASEPGAGAPVDEVRRAGNIYGVRINYAWSTAHVSIGIKHNGHQFDDFFPPYPPYQERVRLGGYTLVDVEGQYPLSRQVTLTARIENALDSRYEEVYGFASAGFTAFAGVRVHW